MKLYESEGHKVKAFLLPGRGQNVGKATVSGAESKDKRTGGMERKRKGCGASPAVWSQEGTSYGTRIYTHGDLTGRQCWPPGRTEVHRRRQSVSTTSLYR